MVRPPLRARVACAIVVVTVAAACHRGLRPNASTAGPVPRAGPTDANIAAILLTANSTDISYAELVPTRSDRADVKEFAQRMLTDHSAVNQRVTELLVKINLTPEDNITSLDLRDESATKRDILHELAGHAFDSTYMANEVSYHTKLLKTIDSVLAPDVHNQELAALIGKIRPAVAAHLEHAQRVQAAVAGK